MKGNKQYMPQGTKGGWRCVESQSKTTNEVNTRWTATLHFAPSKRHESKLRLITTQWNENQVLLLTSTQTPSQQTQPLTLLALEQLALVSPKTCYKNLLLLHPPLLLPAQQPVQSKLLLLPSLLAEPAPPPHTRNLSLKTRASKRK